MVADSAPKDKSKTGEEPHKGVYFPTNGFRRTALLGILSALLFGIGVAMTEIPGELLVDIDLKPFFIPYLLILLSPFGIPTLSIALGGALGEGFLDVFEGYELDDPFGFLGYAFGFYVFGLYLDRVASDPTSRRAWTIAALLGAFIQALLEGIAFLIFEPTKGVGPVVLSVLGNTATHGLILGAIPLFVLFPYLRDL